ncbi:DUF5994 family protein [Couchioplanes caeruleus]|uniref:Uncharacterized protein n=2 Tax=Couchioplanes caeruleus TaxID=56438 RepID=A0A1K0FIF6_9ACTN|nr:DUF5994 family protein [Couchioplanes caeruleus]OJF12631.1 hypothetical protein BG844_19555 [Couchioplanes caeruleus subsp. caeruleus]ROP28418.1 hypothetical protein EDD30_1176 [Couchioplanes caeruleus]
MDDIRAIGIGPDVRSSEDVEKPVSLHRTLSGVERAYSEGATDGSVIGAGPGRRALTRRLPGAVPSSSASVDLVLALVIGRVPRLRWSRTTGTSMASLITQRESSASTGLPRVRLEPVRLHYTLLDGSWWPSSTDLNAELRVLVPVLEQVRGPVTRLLLGAANWTARPHHLVVAGRVITVLYLAGQSPSMMTVVCADGGTFTLRVAPPGPPPGMPDRPEPGPDEETWETEGGGLGPLRTRAVR